MITILTNCYVTSSEKAAIFPSPRTEAMIYFEKQEWDMDLDNSQSLMI
jgi:hypothetical protein